MFSILVRFFNPEGGVLAGTYSVPGGENVFSVAYRLARGVTGITSVKVTIPEGFTAREMGVLLEEKLGDFDAEHFVALGKAEEGYLFPDTYFFLPGSSPESVIAAMRRTFDERVGPLAPRIEDFGRPLDEVVTMASLLEKEARRTETRRTIAGILWKRLDRGMSLQVDAVFGYIFGTTTFSPSFDDLEVDSPYNTYRNVGLPPGPIANPGLDAIEAAITPIETPYWYYLTDGDGVMRYAKTFEGHKQNRERYLR
jgi:UPF0755 protein